MLTADMLDSHWQFFQAKTSVSYIPYDVATDSNLSGSTVSGIEALQQEPTKEEYQEPTDDSAHNQRRVWNLRLSQLNGTVVTKRGIIRDADGKDWVVIRSVKRSLGTRWNCLCYALTG